MATNNIKILLVVALLLGITVRAQTVTSLDAISNKTIVVEGDLSQGAVLETLRWAWNSSVACFTEIQAHKFSGNHVLYVVTLPKYSEMEVMVTPKDKEANLSLYAYQIGQLSQDNLVPNLSSCIRCEADYKWDYKYKGKTQDHTRTVKNLVAINNPYQVVIGVVGANDLTEGDFVLQVTLKTK